MAIIREGRFIHIAFNWSGAPKIKELEGPLFNQATDWMRYAPNCWVVWTYQDSNEWYRRVRPFITERDRVFICEININDRQGWMDQWAWNWLNRPRKAEVEFRDSST